jgi:hypothetical protein
MGLFLLNTTIFQRKSRQLALAQTATATRLDELTARLERRMEFSLSVTDRELYIAIGSITLAGNVVRYPLDS